MSKISVERVNSHLQYIFSLIEQHDELKKKISFSLRPKREATQTLFSAKSFKLDLETSTLLNHPSRTLWLMQPQHFVSFCFAPLEIVKHPLIQAVWQCLSLDEANAQATIVRRCYLVVLDYLQKTFQLSAIQVAEVIAPFRPQTTRDELVARVELILKRGSRYAVWESDIGQGTVVVMGLTMRNEFWEQKVPKSGPLHDGVVNVLIEKGLGNHAATQRDLRDAVVNHLLGTVHEAAVAHHTQSNHLWNQAMLTATYTLPDRNVLAFTPSSRLLLPDENCADEALGASNEHRRDRAEIFGQHV